MKGAVAAGHPLTAQAGARILAEGGNAVDACIAAAFVSWVAESPLTGPVPLLVDEHEAAAARRRPAARRARQDGLRRHPFRRADDSVLPHRAGRNRRPR